MKLKEKFLVRLTRNWSKNKNKKYMQTWYYMPLMEPFRGMLQFICGLVGGHELSETEWFADDDCTIRWCRWCDKRHKVPKETFEFALRRAQNAGFIERLGEELYEYEFDCEIE